MVTTGITPVTAAVSAGTRARMKDALEAEKSRRIIMSSAPRWRTQGLSRNDAAEVRALWRSEVVQLREEGELLDIVDALAVCGIRAELEERGWNRKWKPVPAPVRRGTGRWPGSRDGQYAEGISMRLPADLAAQVLAACWWSSAKYIQKLRDWRDAHPGIVVPRRFSEDEDERTGPLAVYERLAAKVTTPGDIYRAGLDRGIEAAHRLNEPCKADR